MHFFRFLLFPFAVLYHMLTNIRNLFFEWGWFTTTSYEVPTIGVGNLSTGGTGKSVVIHYLIELLKDTYPLTTLSRGYGRKSKGFILANPESKVTDLGDEPMMFFKKHPYVQVAVSSKRKLGMSQLLKKNKSQKKNVYLWDDCFQHRWVSARKMILLTTFANPFYDDFLLPMGSLRESTGGAKRADIILITKCPKDLLQADQKRILSQVKASAKQKVFFSTIKYANFIVNNERKLNISILENISFLLVTGIANHQPLLAFLKSKFLNFKHLAFRDHHHFVPSDVKKIKKKSKGLMILTTEKDYVRLSPGINSDLLFYLPIEMEILFDQTEEFNQEILDSLYF